jgi:hypothetical protein
MKATTIPIHVNRISRITINGRVRATTTTTTPTIEIITLIVITRTIILVGRHMPIISTLRFRIVVVVTFNRLRLLRFSHPTTNQIFPGEREQCECF